jgi:RNA polymerase sigma factor (TIGR02999 family)
MYAEKELTQLLVAWSSGNRQALEELIPLVFDELRRLAQSHFRRERVGHTLQPTALVNELYLRLAGQEGLQWESRVQFFAFASGLLRGMLVDHYRARQTAKRGGGALLLPLEEAFDLPNRQEIDLLPLNDALTALETLDPRQSRIVELRFFGGLTLEETAQALELSIATVRREWATAKSWLAREMRGS